MGNGREHLLDNELTYLSLYKFPDFNVHLVSDIINYLTESLIYDCSRQ